MATFEAALERFESDFKSFTENERNLAIERILLLCGPLQLRLLSDVLPNLVKRDFIKFLPVELAFHVAKFLDYQTLGRCCVVSKSWNRVLSSYSEIWSRFCDNLGVLNSHKLATINDINWKLELQNALCRLRRLRYNSPFFSERKSNLLGHVMGVTALCYNDGLLASGSNDRSVRLWDVESGVCKHHLICHSCTDLKFDSTQVVTASCDNTLARWEWITGNCLTKYQGHVGAVHCVDYNEELDMVVSGSSDHTVKFWQMSAGSCLTTKQGHQNWLISVLLVQIAEEYQTKLQRKHVAISMSRDCIKVWSVSIAEEYGCIATLSSSSETCPVNEFCPKLLCNGRDIICSSDKGVCIWNLETFQLTRLFQKHHQLLVAYGNIFTLCWKDKKLRVLNNKTEECLYEMKALWPGPLFRFIDCGGETAWLTDCSAELECGPVYFAPYDKTIVVLKWRVK